jgi:mannosyltransferase OCH1-like enzyme
VEKWKALHPDYDIRIRTDSEVEKFLKKHSRDVVERWKSVSMGAVRADIYRYLVLYVEGGVYADMDCEPLRSIEELRSRYDKPGGPPPVVVGMEIGPEYHNTMMAPGTFQSIRRHPQWTHKGMCLCQWCMMAAPGSIAMKHSFYKASLGLSRIERAISRGMCNHVVITSSTGPIAMTQAILSSKATRNGVHIISSEFFCAGSHGRVPLTSKSLVKHHFTASWKKEGKLGNQFGS